MAASRIANYTVREVSPDVEREVDLVRSENRVFVQAENGVGADEGVREEALARRSRS